MLAAVTEEAASGAIRHADSEERGISMKSKSRDLSWRRPQRAISKTYDADSPSRGFLERRVGRQGRGFESNASRAPTPSGMAIFLILAALLVLNPLSVLAWPSGLPTGVSVTRLAAGLPWATDIAWISEKHVLVSTKDGLIYLMNNWNWNGNAPLIDLRSRVLPAAGDRGLTSVAVHPQFQASSRRTLVAGSSM